MTLKILPVNSIFLRHYSFSLTENFPEREYYLRSRRSIEDWHL